MENIYGNLFIIAYGYDVGNKSSACLSHFFDFGTAFADQGAALAGRNDEPQGYWRLTGGRTVTHGVDYVLNGKRGHAMFY